MIERIRTLSKPVIHYKVLAAGRNDPKEGMYFAVRNFFYKLGMTAGIMIFTILTLWGKDPGDDFGIRLNGWVGFICCVVAGLTFLLFRERSIQKEIEELKNK